MEKIALKNHSVSDKMKKKIVTEKLSKIKQPKVARIELRTGGDLHGSEKQGRMQVAWK